MSYYQAQGQYRSDLGLDWGSVTGFAKDVGKGAISIFGESQAAKGRAEAAAEIAKAQAAAAGQRGGMPGWLLPVAAGVGVIALVVLLKKKRT